MCSWFSSVFDYFLNKIPSRQSEMREMCHYLACKNLAFESHASVVSVTAASSALAPLVLIAASYPTIFTIFQTPMSFAKTVCVEGEGPVCLNCQQ